MSDSRHVLEKRDVAMALGLALVVVFAGSLRIAPGVCGGFHDDAIYVSTAEALASGQGYRLIDVPGAPLQTKYPILYPAILSIIWSVWPSFPDNLLAMQLTTLAMGAATVAVAYLYLIRFGYFSRSVAAAAGLVCATSSYFLYYAVQTMAEMPFALLTLAALWGVEKFLNQPNVTWSRQFGWGVVLALPFLCRTIGVTLIVSSLWVLWLHRRPLRWYANGAACIVVPWIMWSMLGRGIWDQSPVYGYYTDYFGCWSTTGMSRLSHVGYLNAIMVALGSAMLPFEGISTILESWLGTVPSRMLLAFIGLAPWLAMIPDLLQRRALAWMMAAYLGAMIVWSWPPYRFLVPILPFLAAYLLRGLATLLSAWRERIGFRLAGAMGLAIVVLTNLWLLDRHAAQVRQNGFPLARLDDTAFHWSSFEKTFAWLRENSEPEDVIASGLDSMLALYTGRPAIRPFVYESGRLFYSTGPKSLITPAEFAEILKTHRPKFLVQTPMAGFAEEKPLNSVIDELRQCYPGWLVVSFQDADPRFIVFEFDQQHEPGKRQ